MNKTVDYRYSKFCYYSKDYKDSNNLTFIESRKV